MPTIIRSDIVIDKPTSYADEIQVAPGVNIIIKAGASLDLGGKKLLNYGTIKLEGTESSLARLINGTYSTDSTNGSLVSNYGAFERIVIDSFFSKGSLSLNNTVVKNSVVDALNSSNIENSLFINSP